MKPVQYNKDGQPRNRLTSTKTTTQHINQVHYNERGSV